MAKLIRLKFKLFGAHKGKNIVINNHVFINGTCEIFTPPENLIHTINYLNYYRAYPEGSVEYENALKEELDGSSEIQENAEQRETTKVDSGVLTNGGGLTEEIPNDGNRNVNSENGDSGSSSIRDRYQDSGLRDFAESEVGREVIPNHTVNEALSKAIMSLDPDNDDHWTTTGKPKMTAIEAAYGSTGITRADVIAAMQGADWTRTQARTLKVFAS